ncbi:MAG: aminoglycoside phosphotransferase family protein [Gemmataceae bacterium]|nr:aminoglycoside phosphotransferase family protein [Gemmataceae bacterium]
MDLFSPRPPHAVIEHFQPHPDALSWVRASDGFSGAVVWRGDDPTGTPRVALKRWQPEMTAERLRQVHGWLGRAAHLPFIPTPLAGRFGLTAVLVEGHLWDAVPWMPGTPLESPTAKDVRQACEAVAALHRAWGAEADPRPAPAVRNRIRVLEEHRAADAIRARGRPGIAPELDELLRACAAVVGEQTGPALDALRVWEGERFHLRPCVRDLRGEHVLFGDGRVTGVVDFGAVAVDHPAVDLARLLSDLTPHRPDLFEAGLSAYRAAGGELDCPDDWVRLLARTGVICSLAGWRVRLLKPGARPVSSPAAVAGRLRDLLGRAGALF